MSELYDRKGLKATAMVKGTATDNDVSLKNLLKTLPTKGISTNTIEAAAHTKSNGIQGSHSVHDNTDFEVFVPPKILCKVQPKNRSHDGNLRYAKVYFTSVHIMHAAHDALQGAKMNDRRINVFEDEDNSSLQRRTEHKKRKYNLKRAATGVK